MEKIFFSVVIPLFNKQYSVIRAIESVLAQTYDSFELVIINDGSTDLSRNSCLPFLNNNKVRLIDQSNSGVAAARNNGVLASKYEYICFLDADDEWRPDFLGRIANLFEKFPEISFCAMKRRVFSEKSVLDVSREIETSDSARVVKDFYMAYARSSALVHSSSVAVRKSALLQVGLFPVGAKTGEDVYLWLRLGAIGKFAFDSKTGAFLHHDAENRTVTRVPPEIPYFLQYFLCGEGAETVKRNFSLKIFLIKYSFIYSLMWREFGREDIIKGFSGKINSDFYVLSRFLWVFRFLPSKLFSFLRKW